MIERNTTGLIETQFTLLEKVMEASELPLSDQVRLATKLSAGIRGIAALNLAHQKEVARAPEFGKKGSTMALVDHTEKK